MNVSVRDNQVEQANKILRRKMQRAGIYQEVKMKRHFEKPCEIRTQKAAEKKRRIIKFMKKRMEKEGY